MFLLTVGPLPSETNGTQGTNVRLGNNPPGGQTADEILRDSMWLMHI